MQPLSEYSLSELKLIYQVLHAGIINHTGLMDSILLQDLQQYLQARASEDNVDVSSHMEWAAWLENQGS